ncbi:recombinase RecT [Aurantimonas coralicida]|uniref:recombinase RecT n=1 Tax=Aurantimonas coralicida TaxID=182270 RepID=UPI001E44BAAA|nr:recombinase RecT [Aurantimonas coralicida]MCD1645298.1 recombinase RecT [Aurantimonas coralicida]
MNQIAIREDKTSINAVAFGRTDSGSGLAPQNLGDIVRFAEVMSRADIAIPKHLRENPGACLAVCMQAFKWEMDPFAVAQKSYKVGDQMAYEAQLIAAVINTRAGLKKRPQIEYQGEGQDRKCIVTFQADDGSVHVYESPRFAAITTKNSPLWKSDPDQQLGYYSIRAGARRHFPEVILGVYDRDEIAAARDVTPAPDRPSLADRMAAAKATGATQENPEGFDRSFIEGELRGSPDAATAEETALADNGGPHAGSETWDGAAVDGETGRATGEGGGAQTPPDTAETPAANDAEGGAEGEVDPADEREDPTVSEADRMTLARYAKDLFGWATKGDDAVLRRDRIGKAHARWKIDLSEMSEDGQKMAGAILSSAQAINKGDVSIEDAAKYYAIDALDVPLDTVMPKGGE